MKNGYWFLFFFFVSIDFVVISPVLAAMPMQVWVNALWTSRQCGGHSWQIDAFAHIQPALAAVSPRGTVLLAAGSYAEKLVIDKPLTLNGPGMGMNPSSPNADDPFAANPARTDAAQEAVIVPPAIEANGILVEIRADDVTLDGLTLDGHNPAISDSIPGGVPLNGISGQIASGVGEEGGHPQRFAILNCIIRNFSRQGIYFKNDWLNPVVMYSTQNVSLGGVVMHNRFDNISAVAGSMPEMQPAPTGVAMYFYNNVFAEVLDNTVTRCAVGLWMANYHSGSGCLEIRGNALQVYLTGVGVNTMEGWSDCRLDAVIAANHIMILPPPAGAPAGIERDALYLLTLSGSDIQVSDNAISGGEIGVMVWDIQQASHLVLANDIISDCQYGIVAANNHPVYGASVYKKLLWLVLNHVTIFNIQQAGLLLDDHPGGDEPLQVTVANGTTIVGGKIGILLKGAHTKL